MQNAHDFSSLLVVDNFLDAFAEEIAKDEKGFQAILTENGIHFDKVHAQLLHNVEQKILHAQLDGAKSDRSSLLAKMKDLLKKLPEITLGSQSKIADIFSVHGLKPEEAFFRKLESITDEDLKEIVSEIELLNLWDEIDPKEKD